MAFLVVFFFEDGWNGLWINCRYGKIGGFRLAGIRRGSNFDGADWNVAMASCGDVMCSWQIGNQSKISINILYKGFDWLFNFFLKIYSIWIRLMRKDVYLNSKKKLCWVLFRNDLKNDMGFLGLSDLPKFLFTGNFFLITGISVN